MTNIIIYSLSLIFAPILGSVVIYILNRTSFNYVVFVVQGIISVILYKIWTIVLNEGVMKFTLGGWTKQIGIEFKIDGLSLMFMTMAVLIWWVVLIYAWHQKKTDFKFLFFLVFLEGCFLALVQVNDFFTLFVLIEIVTIISSILILYKKDGISLKAGMYYLLFNSIGMSIYLFGVAMIYLKVGTLNMSLIKVYLISQDFMSVEYSIIQISFACFLVSMCVKAALFPVYDWLPRAHTAAPSHVSALLSGLLVKTGVYGVIRVLDVYHVENVYPILFYLGFFTAISGIFFAISQKDIKGILAFHTISQIGLIIMSLSANTDIGTVGAYMHIFNHFLFKSLLFLGAGIIINEYGLRRVSEIHGIGRAHPLLTICMAIGIFSITGAPLFVGFLSKNMIKLSMLSPLHLNLYRVVSLGTMISFIKFSKIFFGEPTKNKKINVGQQTGVVILAALCIFFYIKELDIMRIFMSIEGKMSDQLIYSLNYVEKTLYDSEYLLEYLLYFMVGFAILKILVRPDSKFWHAIRHFRMKFQDAVVSLLVFLVLMINYL
jgi:multicomponent Na+:H+ antiporter subunit D